MGQHIHQRTRGTLWMDDKGWPHPHVYLVSDERLKIYYDGACPICSAEMDRYAKAEGAERLALIDATTCDPAELGGLTRDAALKRMHVRRPDGRLVSGAAAFAEIWSALPRWSWAGRLARFPIFRGALAIGYEIWLKFRR